MSSNARGFFLVVEETGVETAAEGGDPVGVVQAMRTLDRTVQVATDFARRRGRTLVIVTGDRDTGGLTIGSPGAAVRLAKVQSPPEELAKRLSDNRANAPVVLREQAGVPDPTPQEVARVQRADDPAAAIASAISAHAGVQWTSQGQETAAAVRVFAFGPGASRFSGELENTQVPARIAEALGMGPFPKP